MLPLFLDELRPHRRRVSRRRRQLTRRDGRAGRRSGAGAAVAARPSPAPQGRSGRGVPGRVRLGARAHDYELIGQMDCDLSHPPSALAAMRAAVDRRAGLVLGSRYVAGGGTKGWSLGRRVISRVGCVTAMRVLRLPYPDLTGGFKLWTAEALRAIDVSTRSRTATSSRSSRPAGPHRRRADRGGAVRLRRAAARRVEDVAGDRPRGSKDPLEPAEGRLAPAWPYRDRGGRRARDHATVMVVVAV